MKKHSIQSQNIPEIPEEDMPDVDDNRNSEGNCPTGQSTIPLEKEFCKRPSEDTPENKLSSKKVKTKNEKNLFMLKKLIAELKLQSSSTNGTTSQAESMTSPSNFSDLYNAIVKAKK
ncbi:hypothetical protein F8M41_016382 [Gigaspora margarita]|uniref:Uncharacterized protein n=1 Tax=Gigaspora margarita TaxID=4874 RepID=A0A8H3ZYU9_GIGMA|nr:hypothetical protein F8M41_016382 [Gigaspora margarita]